VLDTIVQQQGQLIFARVAVMLVALSLGGKVFGLLENRYFTEVSAQISLQVRRDYFRQLMQLEVGYFDQPGSKSTVRGIDSGCAQVGRAFSKNVVRFLNELLLLAGAFLAMVSLSWRLSIVPLAFIPLTTYVTHVLYVSDEEYIEASEKARVKTHRIVSEATSDMRTVRMFGCEEYETGRYTETSGECFDLEAKVGLCHVMCSV
jgi:ABC-type multidrug transport system fused ATPase/permease subunit